MTPEEFVSRFPRLFHLSAPNAAQSIRQNGLLSAEAIVDLLELPETTRAELLSSRRPKSSVWAAADRGPFVITDNAPLSEKKLATCLEDGLSPADWLRILNRKVFFWPDPKRIEAFRATRGTGGSRREVIVFRTAPLVEAHFASICISPINSGSTIHQPARRGNATFANVSGIDFQAWRRTRGKKKPDNVAEVTVDYAVPQAGDYIEAVIKADESFDPASWG